MKKYLLLLGFHLLIFSANAQIFTTRATDESITITPRGIQSKFNTTPTSSNVMLGSDAGKNLTGGNNVAIGQNSLTNTTTGVSNTSIGTDALKNNTVGYSNIAIGVSALLNNVANNGSTAIGLAAMANADNRAVDGEFTYNTAIGMYSLFGSITPANNTGYFNTAIGALSIKENSSGAFNSALGYGSLYNNTEGNFNVALGMSTLFSNKANSRSTAIGYYSMFWADNRTIGRNTYNTAVGFQALKGSIITANNTGQYNTAIGDEAMLGNSGGSHNSVLGVSVLKANLTGNNNAAVGKEGLYSNETGSDNTVLGYQAGYTNVSGSRNVFIGFKAGYNHDADDMLVIENSDGNRALIRGDFANDKVGINRVKNDLDARTETFQVNGDAFKFAGTGNWVIPSDRRLKENIVYLSSEQMLDKVLKMKGVTYNWIDKTRGADTIYGFIAQDLQQIFPENIKTDKEGFLSASYGAYDPMIIESIKALNQKIENLQNENLQLKSHNGKLLKRLDNIEARLNN